jgi:membrane protease YdiL (CAAX protease family)
MSNEPTLEHAIVDSGRLAPGERVSVFWGITLMGICVSLTVGAIYATVKLAGSHDIATTQVSLSPVELVGLNLVVPMTVLATLLAVNARVRPGGLRRLGLGLQRLGVGLLIGAIAGVLIVPLVHTSGWAVEFLWQMIGLKHPDAHPLLRAGEELRNPLLRALIAVSAIALAPAAEELLFRGHLQTAFIYSVDPSGRRKSIRWASVILTSIVFTIFHGELWMMPPIFLLSLCLGWIYERTQNLWAAIVVHALFNASSVVYFFVSFNRAH